jgi:hypothetical protein
MTFSNPSENPDISDINVTNNSRSINIEELQSTHYELMKRCVFVISYAYRKNFPLKTTWLDEDLLPVQQNISKSQIVETISKFIDKFIDIYLLKSCFYILLDELKRYKNKYLIVRVFIKIFTFIVGIICLVSLFWVYAVKILQIKYLILFAIKMYGKNINNELIIKYSRLKTTIDSNSTLETKYKFRFWLTKSINDCKNFNDTLPAINVSKILARLFTLSVAILPAILKNTVIFNWLKIFFNYIYNSQIMLPQLFLVLILYLPIIVIFPILIQAVRAKLFILKQPGIYELESSIYNILDRQNIDTFIEDKIFSLSLLQLFFSVTLIMFVFPQILGISNIVKWSIVAIVFSFIYAIESAKSDIKNKNTRGR